MKKHLVVLAVLTFSLTACNSESAIQKNVEKTYTENEEMTLAFSYGKRTGIYTGQLKDGLPNGEGTFSSVNSDGVSWVYRGQWSDGHCNGQGSAFWEAGQMAIGNYANDELHGDGLLLSEDGTRFVE